MRGNTIENTYRSGEKFETAMIEKKNAQFTYQDGVSSLVTRSEHTVCLDRVAFRIGCSTLTACSLWILQKTFFFMDSETFEEIPISDQVVGDKERLINEGSEVTLVQFKDKIIELVVPCPAVYEIVETEPNVKGNTAQGYTKPATLSCGAVISVPGYLEQGQKIKVDTEKGEYLERVN